MSSDDHVKRPPLDRTQPIRNWSTLFKGPVADGGGSDAESARMAGTDHASLSDVVSRSVDLGYRVVDEYIRQGQKAAQRLNERSYGVQTMAGDVQDLAMRMTQYASDFAAVWLELVQLAAAGNSAPGAPQAAGGAGRGTPEAAMAPTVPGVLGQGARPDATPPGVTRVRIEMRSARATDVAVDIRPDAANRPLIVHALRAVDPDKPRLDGVHFEPGSAEAAACLRIDVPAGHPAGVYSGLMIDQETSRPVGTVSVTIAV
jgi:hypothetical protein